MADTSVENEHDWVAGIRNGMPVLTCARRGCRFVWWPDRPAPRYSCKGQGAAS